jgi:Mg/Co/Ni transporter MgtE
MRSGPPPQMGAYFVTESCHCEVFRESLANHADIAEILDELDFNEATYIFKVLDSEAEILLELEDDLRKI